MKCDVVLKGVHMPDGWEATGEYRRCNEGEHHVHSVGLSASYTTSHPVIIIRPKLSTALQACKLLYDSMQPNDAEYRQATCLAAAALREAGVLE